MAWQSCPFSFSRVISQNRERDRDYKHKEGDDEGNFNEDGAHGEIVNSMM